jgi:Leucine-rich repeat (LRR) protein
MQRTLFVSLAIAVALGAGCTSSQVPIQQATTEITPSTFQNTTLMTLDLSNRDLDGAIPAEIGNLKNLIHLDLSDNRMTGLPAEIGKLQKLETLDLSNNQLTGLPLELGNLSNLQTLDLRGNPYSSYDLNLIRARLPETTILVDE